jgi:hypothetical protein
VDETELMSDLTDAGHRSADDFPWRRALPSWPDDRRERWGLRANALAEAGVPWPEDERRAFDEVAAEDDGATIEAPGGPARERTGMLF